MIRTMMAAILLAGLACSGALANETIRHVDAGTLRAVVERLGHENLGEAVLENGAPAIEARQPDGFSYALIGVVCEDGRCLGMMSQVEFDNDIGLTANHTNEINLRWAAVKAVLFAQSVQFSRYDIADGGTSTEALAASVDVLLSVTAGIIAAFQQAED